MGLEVKKMAEALKAGATMLNEACPVCSSPLFKMPSDEIYCLKCNRKVILVKTEEEALKVSKPATLNLLEDRRSDLFGYSFERALFSIRDQPVDADPAFSLIAWNPESTGHDYRSGR